jgi:hypothetical protein
MPEDISFIVPRGTALALPGKTVADYPPRRLLAFIIHIQLAVDMFFKGVSGYCYHRSAFQTFGAVTSIEGAAPFDDPDNCEYMPHQCYTTTLKRA